MSQQISISHFFLKPLTFRVNGSVLKTHFFIQRPVAGRIEQDLKNKKNVLITAPPGVGKSSLLDYIQSQNLYRRSVFFPGTAFPDADQEVAVRRFFEILSSQLRTEVDQSNFKTFDNVLFVIDDAQILYAYPDIWTFFHKNKNSNSPILAAASYGDFELSRPSTPHNFDSKYSWADLQLEPSETNSLFLKIRNFPSYSRLCHISDDIRDVITTDVGIHIGLFRCLMQTTLNHFIDIKHENPSENEILQYYFGTLLSDAKLERYFPLPRRAGLTEKCQQILRSVYLGKQLIGGPSEELKYLVQTSILNDTFEFSTILHQRYFFCLLYPAKVMELPTQDIDEWILLVLSSFQPDHLRSVYLATENRTPIEGILQQEFARGASFFLPPSISFQPEISRVLGEDGEAKTITMPSGHKGRLDFWINNHLKWAIELLINGCRRGEHFAKMKFYSALEPNHTRVIDFRVGQVEARCSEEGYMVVCLHHEFSTATVKWPARQQQCEVRLVGHYDANECKNIQSTYSKMVGK